MLKRLDESLWKSKVTADETGRPRAAIKADLEFGVVHLPMPGEKVSGDGWGVEELRDKYTFTVVDGLGHGLGAAPLKRRSQQQRNIATSHR